MPTAAASCTTRAPTTGTELSLIHIYLEQKKIALTEAEVSLRRLQDKYNELKADLSLIHI